VGVAGALGAAGESSVVVTGRLYPGALVAPCFFGETASRGELLYHVAERAIRFAPHS